MALRGDGAAYRVESMADDTKQRLDAANAQVADLQARLDAKTSEAAKLQAQLDEAKAQTDAAKAAVEQARKDGFTEGEARAELIAQAKTICGAEYKADGKDAVAVRRDMQGEWTHERIWPILKNRKRVPRRRSRRSTRSKRSGRS